MPQIERSIYIEGDPQAVYTIGKNLEEYPQFMPDVESVKVVEKSGRQAVSEWITNVEGTPIIWKEEDIFLDEKLEIHYKLIEGDLEKFEGEWRFVKEKTGTKVILRVDYDFGMPSLTELIGPTLELKVRENCDMMLEAMKKKIEKKSESAAV
jgi:ribosome-associated toxin RatA of RatAB toxin-antitoxin module